MDFTFFLFSGFSQGYREAGAHEGLITFIDTVISLSPQA